LNYVEILVNKYFPLFFNMILWCRKETCFFISIQKSYFTCLVR